MNKICLKMTNAEIFGFWNIFKETFENDTQYLPARVSFYFYKNLSNLNNALEIIEQARRNILLTYGNFDSANNTYHFDEDKKNIANQELQELLQIEQEVEIILMALSWFDNLNFTSKQMQILGIMIEED